MAMQPPGKPTTAAPDLLQHTWKLLNSMPADAYLCPPLPLQACNPPGPCSFLAPGQAFAGTQCMYNTKGEKEEEWNVTVRIQVRWQRPSYGVVYASFCSITPGAAGHPVIQRVFCHTSTTGPSPPRCTTLPPVAAYLLRQPTCASGAHSTPQALTLAPQTPCCLHSTPQHTSHTPPLPCPTSQGYDPAAGYVCGVMEAHVPTSRTPVVTFWEGELVDNVNHCFTTRNWEIASKDNMEHWSKFKGFSDLKPEVRGLGLVAGASTGAALLVRV